MSGNASPTETAPASTARRSRRPILRQATLILPQTGERVRKTFTLRSPFTLHNGTPAETRPLLRQRTASVHEETLFEGMKRHITVAWSWLSFAISSRIGQDILKCSIAYLLGSLATLVLPIASSLGHQDGKHMVATITVYFHPARSAGSMFEATGLALIAFAYAAIIAFASMAISAFFGSHNLLAFGHAIVLIVFIGAGLGFVGWLKQKLGNPLVNVACSLTSLAIITVLTKEGAVQAASFSYDKVIQVLKMVIMGITISTTVSMLVKPKSARQGLYEDLSKVTDLLEVVLTLIATGFLTGSDEEIQSWSPALTSRYRTTFNSLMKNLREAKFEHYILGTEEQYKVEARLVKCIERLAQNLTGLRSAATTQFDLLEKSGQANGISSSRWNSISSSILSPSTTRPSERFENLEAITEEPEDITDLISADASTHWPRASSISATPTESTDIFGFFISHLGPAMKSLAYTLKEILHELPFRPGSDNRITVNENFASSLAQAKDLFSHARKEALELLYRNRVLVRAGTPEVAADYEEVAASCGYFSSCLQDFAEDTISYLDILEELRVIRDSRPRKRSWKWLLFWRRQRKKNGSLQFEDDPQAHVEDVERRMSQVIPDAKRYPEPTGQELEKAMRHRPISIRIWRTLSFLRREDVKFAIKVGIGAVLYAMFSFIPSTRPFYSQWRGEWGLLSYMLVCSMTIGASNTTGLQRFLGTCLGALLAIATWIISNSNPIVLGLLGWIVSIGCFYVILGMGKGPMGRFILLTYNLSALYAYSLLVRDYEDDSDEGGINPAIWEIVLHRVVAVISGCLWGLIVTRVIWPISARKKLKNGTSLLWLRMGLIWKRDPLTTLLEDHTRSSYMDIRESIELQRFLTHLGALRDSATYEFELRGPFAEDLWKQILEATGRMLGAFHSMHVVILKDLKSSPGEAELLSYTKLQRLQLSTRISHLFSVLASSMKLEYPINDSLPNIEHTRDRFLTKVFDFRADAVGEHLATDKDFELLYAYALVTGQIAKEIEKVGRLLERLYGVLDEDNLKLE